MSPFTVYGRRLSKARVRAAWAALTDDPHMSMEELGALIGCGRATACKCVKVLCQFGVVQQVKNASRTRVVVVPFLVDHRIRILPRVEEVEHAA